MIDIKCDCHTHTFLSALSESTLEENIGAAADRGLNLIASTDTFSSLAIASESELDTDEYLGKEGLFRRLWNGIKVLKGCEADIVSPEGYLLGIGTLIKQGESDTKDTLNLESGRLDFIIAGVNRKWGLTGIDRLQATRMYISVAEDPRVLMIGHPGREGISFEVDDFIKACKELGKPVEINEKNFAYGEECVQFCTNLAKRCAEMEAMICVNSDAHSCREVGVFEKASSMLEKIHFPQKLIMNSTADVFLERYYQAGFTKMAFIEENINENSFGTSHKKISKQK